MDESQQETVAIKACSACRSGLLDRDKFCRWCGERQPERLSSTLVSTSDDTTERPTPALATDMRDQLYRRISGPLVTSVLTGAFAGVSAENQSRFIKRVVVALVSIPVWLIIVLLSPLDAYAAVKSLERQI